MSVETVRAHLEAFGRQNDILESSESSATVAQAAAAFGIEPERIAKTLSFRAEGDACTLIVMAGDARTDNALFKTRFGRKSSMVREADVERLTGHQVGGVCPFANPTTAEVWLDTSLQRFDVVYPAAGSANSAIKLTPEELLEISGARGWVTVSRIPE
jgi:prolyl-tRNA editing enzyme YbaK/EbsC (Cys-tRNA(Pro) deacylase)|uniref:tRNA proofreading protein STM4549 n=1 Tax=uncultured bacterium A1Q1_fos_2116 TaxID=1256564 RepID=L7VW75_9BACT|nr:tRNA proofreading protein STM4549 [uncultured bacterium A1Q1_fos_2116]